MPLCVLAAVMIIDYATGIAAAWSCKLLSSRVGVKGIVKKVAYLALVAVGMVVDYLISSALVHVGVDILVNYSPQRPRRSGVTTQQWAGAKLWHRMQV